MKKKFYYAGMLAAGLLTFASCNNDEDPIVGGGQTPTEETSGAEIVLSIANGGDGLTTRAGRPLLSSEAKQNIDKVTVVIFSKSTGTIIAEKTFDDWMSVSTAYGTATDGSEDHGRKLTWKLTTEEREALPPDGSVAVYAVGYNTSEPLYSNIENDLQAVVPDGTTTSTLASSLKQTVDAEGVYSRFYNATLTADAGFNADEIFAGEIADLEVNDAKEFDLEANPEANVIILRRQVTGTFGYFTNIPTSRAGGDVVGVEDLSLRLVASNRSNTIMFAHFNSDFTSAEESDAMYVINGWQGSTIEKDAYFATAGDDAVPTTGTKDAYSIYTIDLKDWFPNGDVTGDGILGEADAAEGNGDNWVSPAENNQEIAGFKPGSVFAGNFIIPFEKESGVNTLQLQLIGYDFTIEEDQSNADQKTLKAGTSLKVLRTWNINLRSDDPQIGTVGNNAHMVTLDHTNGEPTGLTSGEEKANSYSLVRNHLYSVGEKGTDGYNPDTDIPEDLSRNMNLILRVNDNWEMIHKMEVE